MKTNWKKSGHPETIWEEGDEVALNLAHWDPPLYMEPEVNGIWREGRRAPFPDMPPAVIKKRIVANYIGMEAVKYEVLIGDQKWLIPDVGIRPK